MADVEQRIVEALESVGGRADESDLFRQVMGGTDLDEPDWLVRSNPDRIAFDTALQRLHLKGRVRCVPYEGERRRGYGQVNVMGLPSTPAWELVR